MSARKSNFAILVLGVIAVSLLGLLMWFMEERTPVADLMRLVKAVKTESRIPGTDFALAVAARPGQKGLKLTWRPPEVLLASEGRTREEARRAAFFLFSEVDALNAEIRERNRKAPAGAGRAAPRRSFLNVRFVSVVMLRAAGAFGCSEEQAYSITINRQEYGRHKKLTDLRERVLSRFPVLKGALDLESTPRSKGVPAAITARLAPGVPDREETAGKVARAIFRHSRLPADKVTVVVPGKEGRDEFKYSITRRQYRRER